jgi:oligopeptide/dipeptide ABC transporter ATP-binding protein
MALLEVENLRVEFRTRKGVVKALDGVSLGLDAGETVGLVGESGAGKSVLGRAIMGLLQYPGRITGGRILWQGRDLVRTPERAMRQIRNREIAIIFQDPMTALDPLMTIGQQVVEALRLHRPIGAAEARELAIEKLRDVEIPQPHRAVDSFPHQFSGGMRQRVVIAIALANDPRLVIADEPTTALDVTIQAQILKLLHELQARHDMSVLMVTHNLAIVAEFCRRVVVLYAGHVMEEAETSDVFERPLHPYTRGLLRSIIRMDRRMHRLETLPGLMPDLIDLPPGCVFYPRCPERAETCRAYDHRPVHPAAGRSVACCRV